jgi:2-oxoisovalerate dehydrogenase E1 component
MSSPTDHYTYPKSFEARRQLKGFCEEPIEIPISRFDELLHFQYNDEYFRKVNTKAELKEAHKAALSAPDPTPESIYNFVLPEAYQSEKYPNGIHNQEGEKKKLITGLNETLKAEFRHNPDTFIWGQDVAHKEKGGIFNVTKGMQQEFGKERVFNGPIAEDFILGTANGFVRFDPKIRVVVEGAEFADYFWPAMEQMVETSHDYWRSNGKFSPNVVVRIASGGYIGGGLYHSQNIEASLAPLPGIRIVVPAFADDAAGLLRTAMRSQGCTVYLEPKSLYNAKQAMTAIPAEFEVPFGKGRVRRQGSDLSVITYGNTVHFCLEAAEKIAKETGKQVEVFDLRSISPIDEAGIIATVKKTSRALVVHEDKVFAGFGGEIVALINEKAFEFLDAPVKRCGSEFTPVGFNRILEKAVLPNTEKIEKAMLDLLSY